MSQLTLRQYLDSRRTSSPDWNITGMGTGANGWLGKYAIPEEEYDDFLHLTHDHIFKRGKACSLLEKHKPLSPILIDLDFRYAAGGPLRRRFGESHIRAFVAAYADAFARFFTAPEDRQEMTFYVQLKPTAEADTAHDAQKDGIHIVCPSFSTSPEIQYAIRGWLLQKQVIDRIFGDTGMTNAAQDCLDISVIQRNNWFLYGACKPDKAWYKVEHIYSAHLPDDYEEPLTPDDLEALPADTHDTLSLMRSLSIRMGYDEQTPITLRSAMDAEWVQLLGRWGKGSNWAATPSIFKPAAGGAGEASPQEGGSTMKVSDISANDEMVQLSGMSVRSGYSTEDIALAYKLVRECLLPTRRAKNYGDWVNIGLLLHNISKTDESLRVWMEFSRRVPGYERTPDAVFKEKWLLLPAELSALKQGRKPLMMGTLHLWAKEDSEATYREIIANANVDMALLNDSGTHVSVADLVVRMYRHEFRCTPSKKGATAASMDWYQFEEHTWRSLKTWMRLRERLSNAVRNMYIQADRRVGQLITDATNEDERQRLEVKRKNLFRVETQLQNTGFKDSVMKETSEKFYDEEFLQHMNQDPGLIGFSNGVLELRRMGNDGQPHIFFRPGRPDDCISFQMGRGLVGLEAIPYIPYDPATPAPEHLEIQDFFAKIYPDPVLREYCLTLFSACLEGVNREQKFYIMTGKGGNGKSKIIELMSKTFGEYQETLATTALTRKRADAGSANPELIVLKCKRFVSMVEPDEGEKINTALMKQISGEDVLKARGLFQDQDQFVVMARIFMSCNDLPPVSSTDGGTWRRVCVIPHISTFVGLENGHLINPANNIYPRDPLLEVKIPRWRPYFAGMLAWYYENRYMRGGLKEPAQVTSASTKYKEENDAFSAFCQECIIREDGQEARVNDVLARYKEWSRYNPGKKILQKKEIIQKMEETFGRSLDAGGRVFSGIRVAIDGEDVSGNYF